MTIINNIKVAIQGIRGSYHHQVALDYFGQNIDPLACDSFQKVADAIINDEVDFGIMAIENSIAGSILPNYALIDNNKLSIVAEYYLNIVHCFMGLNDQSLADIEEVRSHPMAILQCMETLKKYPHIKIIEDKDTAQVAELISEKKLKGVMAIASEQAANLYDLKILLKDVQTIKDNRTRFFIISKNEKTKTETNKASLKFELDDTPGSLAAVLNLMTNCRLNLTKIQSMPIIETPFQYAFFVDVLYEKEKHIDKALKVLDIMTKHCKVFGRYQSAGKN